MTIFVTIYIIIHQVLNEFTHGKHEKVSKTEFKEVLSDILLGMAAGLKRDPIVILRIDGEDLLEFLNGSAYEPEIVSIFSQIESPHASLHDLIIQALSKLNVDQGIPPTSDPWVANSTYKNYITIFVTKVISYCYSFWNIVAYDSLCRLLTILWNQH